MPPFRSSGRRDRPGRTQIADHDVIDGLPIRQWKQVDAPVGPPPSNQPITGKNMAWPELPMPRDWQMLPEVSQQLLRAARAGKLYKPPTPPNEVEQKRPVDEAETVAKDTPKGFVARKWTQVPRHLEAPEPEHLAKRRKGLSSAYANGAGQHGVVPPAPVATRMTKVRRIDADGNAVVYEVQALEGQPIEGEIVEDPAVETVPVVATVAPGTVIDGVGVANADGLVVAAPDPLQQAQIRRKPPPPRRKKNKGPGRGHKKVVIAEPGADGAIAGQTLVTDANGLAVPSGLANGATHADGDTPMLDAREGEEDESGEEDDEDEEEGSEEGELAQTETPDESVTPSQSMPPVQAPTSDPTSAPTSVPTSVPDPTPLAAESFTEAPPSDSITGLDTTMTDRAPVEAPAASAADESAAPPTEPSVEPATEPATAPTLDPPIDAPPTLPAEPIVETSTEAPLEPSTESTVQPTPEAPVEVPVEAAAADTAESAMSEPEALPVEPLNVQTSDIVATVPDQAARIDKSSSPDEPLASANSHSRHGSMTQASLPTVAQSMEAPTGPTPQEAPKPEPETDLFDSLEKHLEGQEKHQQGT